MQDVFLITALEESISGKWYNGVWSNYFVTDRVAAGMAVVGSLDPCSKGPGLETTFRLVSKCEERISQLSVIPGKKA